MPSQKMKRIQPALNESEGVSHEDFMAVSGLASVPAGLGATNKAVAVRLKRSCDHS